MKNSGMLRQKLKKGPQREITLFDGALFRQ